LYSQTEQLGTIAVWVIFSAASFMIITSLKVFIGVREVHLIKCCHNLLAQEDEQLKKYKSWREEKPGTFAIIFLYTSHGIAHLISVIQLSQRLN